jgi:hypothetical protein
MTFGTTHASLGDRLFGDLAVLGFLLVQVLDGGLTYLGLHTWGPSIEANPVVSSAISYAGVAGGLAMAKLIAMSFGVLLHLRGVHRTVAFLTAFYVAVAIVPWVLLFLSL